MIVTKGLTKRFSDIVAADHISVEIPEGCIYGLVGANGSGKSTFLRLLSGVYKPDEGEVLVDGQPVFDNPASKKKFVFVPDELFFLPQSNMRRMAALYETVYENFDYEMLSSLTETFNLTTERPFNTFSKGMKRQAATILALSARADYIFFDETFDGLDPVMRQLVKRTLYREVVDRNATAILTSHSLRELEDTCDQLALLYRGETVAVRQQQGLWSEIETRSGALGWVASSYLGDYRYGNPPAATGAMPAMPEEELAVPMPGNPPEINDELADPAMTPGSGAQPPEISEEFGQ